MTSSYEAIAKDYDKSLQLLPIRMHVEAFSVLRLVGDVRGLEVLDLACGTGIYARALRRAGASRVVGIDVSDAMIGIARGIEQESQLGIEYRVSDATALDSVGSFDLAVAVYMLHYAPSVEALRAMCVAVAQNLKPGGRFISFSMNPDVATSEGAYHAYGLSLRAPEPEQNGCAIHFSIRTPAFTSPELTAYRWSRATIEAALTDAGLTNIRWDNPDVGEDGVREHGADLWQAYLARPHCLLLSCRKAS